MVLFLIPGSVLGGELGYNIVSAPNDEFAVEMGSYYYDPCFDE